jgi:hypothetical protein
MSDSMNDKPAPSIDLIVDLKNQFVKYKGAKIYFYKRPTYLRMLECLRAEHPTAVPTGVVLSRIWGKKGANESNVYKTRDRLNKRLAPYGLAIHTQPRGVGLRLVEAEPQATPRSPRDGSATVPESQIADGVGPVHNTRGLDDQPQSTRLSSPGAQVAMPSAAFDGSLGRSVETGVAPDAWSQWSDFVSSAAQPSLDALRFADRYNGSDRRIVGAVIELFRHRHLESHSPLETLGWKPEEILMLESGHLDISSIEKDPKVQKAFQVSEETRLAQGKETALQEPNNRKFAISDTSTPFHDVSTLTITFKQTDYFSIQRARPAVGDDQRVRLKYGNLTPSENLIPGAAAIVFAALFSDGEILAIFRNKNTFGWPETWSFSGEEQFDSIDFSWEASARMKFALLRTVQEEIFPLARIYDKNQLVSAMRIVEQYVSSMRVWSIILEEPTATFSVFCVICLACTVDDYKKAVKDMVRRGLGEMSNEGKYYTVPLSAIPRLLQGMTLDATQIFGSNRTPVRPEELHPMSRYRLLRLLEAQHNASLPTVP